MKFGLVSVCLAGGLLAGNAMAQLNKTPAAKVHVRTEGGAMVRYTSKLAKVVELNFTLGFDHAQGKSSIDQILTKIVTDYTVDGKAPFTLQKFTGPNNGSQGGVPNPGFTATDLQSADVIVTNNISNLNNFPTTTGGAAMAAALSNAVTSGGKSILGFHGSGDGMGGWKWYTDSLHPVDYHSHGDRSAAPVYKSVAESAHVALQGLLATANKATVPMGLDASGAEVKVSVPARNMMNEWYQFGRNLNTDPKVGPLTTVLMMYDPTNIPAGGLPNQYKYKGGNPYLWMVKVGNGRAAYVPSGHDGGETTSGNTSFDGAAGDFERMMAQMLFFLAGYTKEPCGGAVNCTGLPMVDAKDRIGGVVSINTGYFDRSRMAFESLSKQPFTAKLIDVHGRVIATKSGSGAGTIEFDRSRLAPGVYVMSVKSGKEAPVTKRYMVTPAH